jgi:hypothetical protein
MNMQRILILIACLAAIVVVLFVQSMLKVRKSIAEDVCEGRLTEVGLAMHTYHEKYGHFPPSFISDNENNPIHSWRVLLLEFLEPDLFSAYRFDEPWNGPNNCRLESLMPKCYRCPAAEFRRDQFLTNYFVVVGSDTAFPKGQTTKLDDYQRNPAQVILVMESISLNVHWMEPRDIEFNNRNVESQLSSNHELLGFVLMADASKKRASRNDLNLIRNWLKIRD